jgi:hypothetical protein
MRCFRLLCLGFLLVTGFVTEGAQLTINVGTAANDGSGDTVRQAFQKVNTNFNYVFTNFATLQVTNGLGPALAFDSKQISVVNGTNVLVKPGAALSNSVFYPDSGGVAWSVADSSQVYITNSIGHLLNSSWIFQGISTLGMDSGSVIYDYPGTLKQWNFKATADANTAARISDVNGATNGVAPLNFGGQFGVLNNTNVGLSSGVALTNPVVTGTENISGALSVGGAIIASNNLQVTGTSTHGGAATFTNAVEAKSTLNVAGAGNVGGLLTASNNAAITGTANVSSTLSAGGAIIASNNLQVTGTSTHGGAATFTNAVEAKSTLNVAGAGNVGGLLTATNGIANQLTFTNTGAANFAAAVTNWVGETTFGVSTNGGAVNNGGVVTNWGTTTFKASVSNETWVTTAGPQTNLGGLMLRGSATAFQHTNASFYGMGLLTDGTNATWQVVERTSQPLLWRTILAMKMNSPIMLIMMGDSLMCTPDPLCNEIVEQFSQHYGTDNANPSGFLGGAGSHITREYGRFGKRWGIDIGGTAYYTNDLSRSYAWHTVLPNAGDLVQHGSWNEGVGSGSYYVTGNVFEVVYAVSNTYSGFSIATNGTIFTNIVCNAAPGALETNLVWRYTNAAGPLGIIMRETCLSNSAGGVRIHSGAIWDNTRPGIVFNNQATPSMTLAQFNSVPTNSMGPVFRSWANVMPVLVMFKTVNGGAAAISNQLSTLAAFLNFNMPTAETVIHGMHPIENNDADVVSENYALRLACTNGVFTNAYYFPSHEMLGDSFTLGLRMSYLVSGGDVHVYQNGANFLASRFWDWANLQGARGTVSSLQEQKIPHVWQNLDGIVGLTYSNGTSFTFQGRDVTGATNFNVGTNGSMEVFGAVTNRTTVRNKGGVTNDVQVVNVGPVENRSTVTNTGAINNAGAVTNWNSQNTINGSVIVGPSGGAITNILTSSANLDFPSTAPTKTSDLNISVTGLLSTDTNAIVSIGVPSICWITNTFYTAFPSNGAVWVRFHNLDTNTSQNPGPAVFKVLVTKF